MTFKKTNQIKSRLLKERWDLLDWAVKKDWLDHSVLKPEVLGELAGLVK